jgi:hypothetical protein
MNDEFYEQQTVGDWVVSVLATVGAAATFIFALVYSL